MLTCGDIPSRPDVNILQTDSSPPWYPGSTATSHCSTNYQSTTAINSLIITCELPVGDTEPPQWSDNIACEPGEGSHTIKLANITLMQVRANFCRTHYEALF